MLYIVLKRNLEIVRTMQVSTEMVTILNILTKRYSHNIMFCVSVVFMALSFVEYSFYIKMHCADV